MSLVNAGINRCQTGVSEARFNIGDHWILICALCLSAIGLVMVYSSSSMLADKRYLDSMFFLKQQAKHLLVGLTAMLAITFLDYRKMSKLALPLLIILFVALLLVLIPGIGYKAGGASRWLKIAAFSIQPSELAKPVLVIFLARWLSEHQEQAGSFKNFLFCLGVIGALSLPILLEPDLGMTITLFLITVIMMFVAGCRIRHLLGMVLAALPVLYLLVFRVNYRLDRITSFLSPWDDPANSGFQIIHSFLAFGSGGVSGAGLGHSVQKLFYLPEPHTDFILSVVGEELGLLGVFLILSLFLIIVWRGVRIAMEAGDLLGAYIAVGAVLIIAIQAFINAAVVMGMLPTKGLTLPFVSYGGSSLLTNFICVGLLLSVAGHRRQR
ncbi:MAG: putative lipid II flippase FtsW [Desulfarculales bacterium]|jgi:cell division protein FtsW|nr:putative lipid II flippase FtsW [Desulfarculales bacterium]